MTRAEMISAIQTLQQEVWGLKEQVARLTSLVEPLGVPHKHEQRKPVRGVELRKLERT